MTVTHWQQAKHKGNPFQVALTGEMLNDDGDTLIRRIERKPVSVLYDRQYVLQKLRHVLHPITGKLDEEGVCNLVKESLVESFELKHKQTAQAAEVAKGESTEGVFIDDNQ